MLWYAFKDRRRWMVWSGNIWHVGVAGFVLFFLCCMMGCSPPRGIYHTVKPGQTLYRIGRAYKIDADYLARINGIREPSQLKVGKRLFIPGARNSKYVPATVVSTKPDRRQSSVKKASKATSSLRPRVSSNRSQTTAVKASVNKNTPVVKKTSAKSSLVKFIWPVHGKIVKSFGQQGYGGRKGVEIGVKQGQKIFAAAAGRVTYSGNGIKGYGNLIILKHADDFFTVYGFNNQNLVSTGAYVGKGEHIATGGVPPGCRGARLHFEIRHGKEALNPVSCLP